MAHLSCFFPGTIALAYIHDVGDGQTLEIAKNLTRTCYRMFESTGQGATPETVRLEEDGSPTSVQNTSLLRSEIIESVYYMFMVTRDEMLAKWGTDSSVKKCYQTAYSQVCSDWDHPITNIFESFTVSCLPRRSNITTSFFA